MITTLLAYVALGVFSVLIVVLAVLNHRAKQLRERRANHRYY